MWREALVASGLGELDWVAGGILEQDPLAAWPGHDVVATVQSGLAVPRDLASDAIDCQVSARAGHRSTIRISFASTFGGPAFPGFSDSVGMYDTAYQVIAIVNPSGA